MSTVAEIRREWLVERPASRMQARLGRAYVTWRRFSANRLAMVGLFIVVALIVVAALADVLAPYSPTIGDLKNARLLPPSAQHWFGTERSWPDIARIIHGCALDIVRGGAGCDHVRRSGFWSGRWLDMPAAGSMPSDAHYRYLPCLPKACSGAGLRCRSRAGHRNAVLAIAVTSWPPYARIARAETLTVRLSH